MRTDYDPALEATVTWDDAGRVRGILYFDKLREMANLRGRAAAEAYIRDIAGNLNVAPDALRGIEQPVSYLDPHQQGVEYRFSEEKASFSTATYVYCQTYLNTPVWGAGITVTLKQPPARVVAATDTSVQGIDAKLPSPEALERYRRLLATGEKAPGGPPSQVQPTRGQQTDSTGSDLLTDILGSAAKIATGPDDTRTAPRLIQGRFFIYRYEAKERTKDESLALPLPPVPNSIQEGSWYLVAELAFRLPYGRTRMNWRILVDVETNAILCVRALSSGVMGKVFTCDPVTITGDATNTADRGNATLNRHQTLEELRNLNPPAVMQSLEGTFAKVVNLTAPDFEPPTRPAGNDFDIWDVRTNEFAAVNAYYHVDRFFRLVEDIGFPVTGPDGYFKGTEFPVEVDHRAFRAPWPDGNIVNSALLGHGSGIDSVYYALADFRGGRVSKVTVTNRGAGYTNAPTVKLSGGAGSGATAAVKPEHVVDGTVTAVTVGEKGTGYRIGPFVDFSEDAGGTGAFAMAEIEVPDPIGIATDWRVTLHELGGHGTLWSHVEDDQFKFAHSAGDSFAMILTDYFSAWHNNGHASDRFLLLPFLPSVPVRRSDRGVKERSVARVNVTNPGSGYLTVTVAGGGVREAKAVVEPQHLVGGAVTQVTVTDQGTGYTQVPLVNFSGGGGGSGAIATAQMTSGQVTGVTITKGGSGYVTPPIVNLTGGGPARVGILRPYVQNGVITKVIVMDAGMGYTSAPDIIISGGLGDGATATAQIADGKLAAVTVTNGGAGYVAPKVELTGAGVSDAKARVKPEDIVQGQVTKITVTSGGTGYTWPPSVTIAGGGGSGAAAIAQIASGSVTNVIVTEPGHGYSASAPMQVAFGGGGVAIATVKPEDVVDGRVTKVTVGDPGTGYTSAPQVRITGGSPDAAGTAELGTWGWGEGMDQGTDGRIGSGYFSEQILSTTMFCAYRSIGGDATSITRREFAARYMAFLMLRAIKTLSPQSNPSSPHEFLLALIAADSDNWISEGVDAGAYGKVLTWAFEKQNLNKGAPPSIDVYIDDGRAGEYQYDPVYWATKAIWNRRRPDNLEGHQEPALGQTNFAYVKIKNRGRSVPNDVIVKGFHYKPSAGLVWPSDFEPLTTPQLAAGTLQPNNAEEKTVGPFEWTPAADASGHDGLLMIVSATGDESNVKNIIGNETMEDWRLVPNDNNIGQRNVVVVPGGGGPQGLTAGLNGKSLTVRNPGHGPATIAVSVDLPPLLKQRGWQIGHDLPAGGVPLNAREERLVTFAVQAGDPFTKADVETATARDIVAMVTANGAIIGGMTYRLDPELDRPFNERAPTS